MNKKRNSTGSALGDTKHAHKISNNSNRKVSSSIRADSTEDHKLSLGVRIKNNIKVLRESILVQCVIQKYFGKINITFYRQGQRKSPLLSNQSWPSQGIF